MHGFVLGAPLFIICHQTQANNFAGKVGKVILHLHNRGKEFLWEGTAKCGWKKREKIISQTQIRLFQRVSILQYLYMHNKPSFMLKVTGK